MICAFLASEQELICLSASWKRRAVTFRQINCWVVRANKTNSDVSTDYFYSKRTAVGAIHDVLHISVMTIK